MRSLLDRLGARISVVLVVSLAVVLAAWAFIAIADAVKAGHTQRFDEWAVRALRKPADLSQPIGPPWVGEAARDVTALGGVTVLSLVILLVAVFLWLREKYHAMWFVLAATVSGQLLSTALKHVYQRPRPNLVAHLSSVYTTSFPSGHSMLSAVVYLTLGVLLASFVEQRRLKIYFVAVAMTLTMLVGVSRVFMGVHYPTDVLAGWSAGLAWASLCWLVSRRLQRRGAIERNLDEPPQSG